MGSGRRAQTTSITTSGKGRETLAARSARNLRQRAAVVRQRFTRAGIAVAALGLSSWCVGWRLGWAEMQVLAGGALVALMVALLWTIGRVAVDVDLRIEPVRIVVGEQAVAEAIVRNPGTRRMLGLRVEIPIGQGLVEALVPSLTAGASHEELIVIPTSRRSVIEVGPGKSVRSDPLHLARRELVHAQAVRLFVHPLTIDPSGTAAGWTRDLEGLVTRELSPADLEFHTLREYTPGDDPRHIHWRSTARQNRYMVRQYHDTRRSTIGLGLSLDADDYGSDEEFELAVSVTGSIARGAFSSSQQVRAVAGGTSVSSNSVLMVLDGLAAVKMAPDAGLAEAVPHLLGQADLLNVIFLIAGSVIPTANLLAAARYFKAELPVVGLRCNVQSTSGAHRQGGFTLLNVARLSDVSSLLSTVAA